MSCKTVGIIGGGLSGLSTAYYLRKKFGENIRPIIFEASARCGGWVRSVTRTNGNDVYHFELGPRTIRPALISGMNTLDLIEELGLSEKVIYVQKDHPAARTRYIYTQDKLVKLPQDMTCIYKKQPPFKRPLLFAIWRDLFHWRNRLEDDSIYNFVRRRFGADVATYLIDPIIRGICAGDSTQISVKFLMKTLFEYEQKYGSVSLGLLFSRFQTIGKETVDEFKDAGVGYSNIALSSLRDNWAVWSLEGGLETLPWMLETYLSQCSNVSIKKNCAIKSIRLGCRDFPNTAEIDYYPDNDYRHPETVACDHIISTIPGKQLGKIFHNSKPSNPNLWKVFDTIHSTTVQVTNLMYKTDDILHDNAFGFLVPSVETSVSGLLGVVFDTCCFPQSNKTILTVMSKPIVNEGYDLDKILQFIKTTMKIRVRPDDYYSEVLEACIPQYTVGHYEKIDAVRRFIKAANFELTLAGASFDGISVNDVIYGAKMAAENFDKDNVEEFEEEKEKINE